MIKINITETKKRLDKVRKLASKSSQFKGMTTAEAVKKLRKTREELWEAKIAAGSRH